MRKFVTAALTGLCLAGGMAVVTAPEASAATKFGCDFPRVCFYQTKTDFNRKRPTASFEDPTDAAQELERSIGAFAVFNSRDDDAAVITSFVVDRPGFDDTLGLDKRCVRPNSVVIFSKRVVTREIQIVDSPTC
jgi:hypothetical protein